MRGYIPECTVNTPANIDEALSILAGDPGLWRPLAGGTDMMVVLAAGRMPDKRFLNITGLPELRGIETTKEHISFGSLCTFTEVLRNEVVHRDLPNLVRSARATGALAIQNRGTLGGNIVNASPAADTPPSLLAYGAELELASLRGRRWIPYERFHLGYKQMDMAPDELLTRIRIPRLEGVGFHFFRKVGTRAAQAISKTCLASYARLDGGRVAEIRIGLGSVAPVPARARHTEALLLDKPLDRLPIREARAALMEDISPIDDIRSTAKYRRIVTANVLEQMLKTLAASGI